MMVTASRRYLLATMASLPVLAVPALAQRGFPEKPIRMIVPYGPGTGTDTLARQFTAGMPALLGQPMLVENRAGANSIVGTEAAAQSAPDGYTLLWGNTQPLCFNPALYRRLPYDVARDFAPVAGLISFSFVLVVAPDLPVRSVADLVALAKAQPGRITSGTTGAGTASRMIADVFALDAGIEITDVPYQSGVGQLFADLMTNRVSLLFYPYQFLKAQIESGRMRALATTSTERPDWMPNLPTLHELGYRRSIITTWHAIFAPAGTPADRIDRVSGAFRQVLENADLRAALRADGTSPDFRAPQDLATFAAAERDRCRSMVELSGVRLD